MSMTDSGSKTPGIKISSEKVGTSNYINKSNIIKENSSDNDIENSNPKENDFHLIDPELRRFTLEYIKVLGLYQKDKENEEININEIIDEFKIPREIIEEKVEEEENDNIKKTFEMSEEETKEEKIDFDNDIQPMPILNQEMKIIIYLSKPKVIAFDGKLGLFYLTPPPIGKESDFNFIIKNPETMKIIFKIKLMEIITFIKKNENCLLLQNFGNKVLVKTNHEMAFKNKEDCAMVHQGITFLMNNKEDDMFY